MEQENFYKGKKIRAVFYGSEDQFNFVRNCRKRQVRNFLCARLSVFLSLLKICQSLEGVLNMDRLDYVCMSDKSL